MAETGLVKEAREHHPDWASALYFSAVMAEDDFDDKKALDYYRLALKVQPNFLEAAHGYANALMRDHKYRQAIAAAQRALALCLVDGGEKELIRLRYQLRADQGQSFLGMHDYSGAVGALEKFVGRRVG